MAIDLASLTPPNVAKWRELRAQYDADLVDFNNRLLCSVLEYRDVGNPRSKHFCISDKAGHALGNRHWTLATWSAVQLVIQALVEGQHWSEYDAIYSRRHKRKRDRPRGFAQILYFDTMGKPLLQPVEPKFPKGEYMEYSKAIQAAMFQPA